MRKNTFSLLFTLAFGVASGQAPLCPEVAASMQVNNLYSNNFSLGGLAPFPDDQAMYNGYDGTKRPTAGLFANGLWLAGVRPDGTTPAVLQTYGFDQWATPGPLDANGNPDPAACARWNRFWKVSRSEVEYHQADLLDNGLLDHPQPAVVGWPGRGNPHFEAINGFPLPNAVSLAPFVDLNGDGVYNAYDGDYPNPETLPPDVLAGGMIWAIFHSTSEALPFELSNTVWALSCEGNDVLNNTIFQTYTVANRGNTPLDSAVIGLWSDFDLGNYLDDYVGTAPELHSVYVYNADELDESFLGDPSWGEHPPVFATTFLNRPLYKSLIPLLSETPADVAYQYLNGYFGTVPQTSGGNGYNPDDPNAQPANFVFPGLPDDPNSWALTNLNLPYADRPVLASAFLGDIAPGQSARLDLAYSFHQNIAFDHLGNVTFMLDRVAQLHQEYQQHFAGACSYNSCVGDCVWPGDTNRDGVVNQCDLLPLGVGFEAVGTARDGLLSWSPQVATDWGQSFNQSYDYKHLDVNGDGIIGASDVEVLKDFWGYAVPGWSAPSDTYPLGQHLRLGVPTSVDTNHITAGQTIGFSIKYQDLAAVHGCAYEVEWDTAYWQVFSAGAFANMSANEAGVGKISADELSGARTQLTQGSNLLPGSLATLIMKAKTIAPTQSNTTYIRFKNTKGIAADGSELILGANPQKFVFAGGSSAAAAPDDDGGWRLFPNPATSTLMVETPGGRLQEVVIYDVSGKILLLKAFPEIERAELSVGQLPRGLVLAQLKSEERVVVKKVWLRD